MLPATTTDNKRHGKIAEWPVTVVMEFVKFINGNCARKEKLYYKCVIKVLYLHY